MVWRVAFWQNLCTVCTHKPPSPHKFRHEIPLSVPPNTHSKVTNTGAGRCHSDANVAAAEVAVVLLCSLTQRASSLGKSFRHSLWR